MDSREISPDRPSSLTCGGEALTIRKRRESDVAVIVRRCYKSLNGITLCPEIHIRAMLK